MGSIHWNNDRKTRGLLRLFSRFIQGRVLREHQGKRLRRIMSQISEARKNLILAVADNYGDAFPFLHSLEKAKRREEIYSWFLRNKITGKKFVTYFEERRYSLLQVMADVLTEIDRKKKEAIIAGVDL